LTLVETSWFFSPFLRDNGFFVSPRLDFVLNIVGSLENILNRVADGKRRKLKQVAAAGYTFEVTKDLSKLEFFYHNMYFPHMLKRHLGYALPISFSECQQLFLKGALLLVKSDGEYLSGNIIVPQGDELWEPVIAVKDVDKYLTLGSYAADYFSILVGIERGFKRMDFGEAPPFMSDGLFQFKKGLGMWVRAAKGSSAQVFGVRFSGLGESVRRFLSVNPFVFVDDEGLSGIVFLERVDALSVKPFCVSGLSRLYILSNNPIASAVDDYQIEKLNFEKNSGEVSALAKISMFCLEENYSLFVLHLKNNVTSVRYDETKAGF
jgi:hypothetical protein